MLVLELDAYQDARSRTKDEHEDESAALNSQKTCLRSTVFYKSMTNRIHSLH
jgi:hypothetical protein